MKMRNLLHGAMVFLALGAGMIDRLPAADDSDAELIEMVVGLVTDSDRDMRAVGLQQVRDEVKGAEATKIFASLLPKQPPEVQAGLLDALADRGDDAARPAVLEMLDSGDSSVRAAALRALGALGEKADVPPLVAALLGSAEDCKKAALASLVRLQDDGLNAAIVEQMNAADSGGRIELLNVLESRRALDTVPDILRMAVEADAVVRMKAMSVLGQLAGPEHVPGMLQGVLKAQAGPERAAAEKNVMFVCNRIEDPNTRAEPVLAAMKNCTSDEQLALLSTLGRIGGPKALPPIEAALGDGNPEHHNIGMRAICNWPDASIAPHLLKLIEKAADAGDRTLALKAYIRVVSLPDKRSNEERLDGLKKAMELCTADGERNFVIQRAKAIRTMDSLHFVLPYLEKPNLAQEACATIVELAHHRKLREPNKAEFDQALDAVIGISKDEKVVGRAKLYKLGKTM